MNELMATPKDMKMVILRGIRIAILQQGSATKVELSRILKISFPTISKFLAQMEKDGEIIQIGLDDSSGGRRATRYTYNPDYTLGLAIYIESTETNYTIFNCTGEIKEQGVAPSVLKEDGLHLLTNCIEDIIDKYPKISSLTIGVPGSVDRGRIFFIPEYKPFQDFDLKSYYEEHFSIPVVVENDMNAAVLGYYNNRKMKDKQSLIYLYSGQNGPGAGIMINGDVVRGNTFFAGEVSFVPQYDDRNFREALEKGTGSKSREICEDHEIDAISRLVASFAAMINPHTIIFCKDEIEEEVLNKIDSCCSKYVPKQHLPELTISDWKQDYLYGLQSIGLEVMLNGTSN